MLAYVASHMGYVLVTLVLVLTVAAIIVRMVKDKKAGKGRCTGDCAGCGCCSAGVRPAAPDDRAGG